MSARDRSYAQGDNFEFALGGDGILACRVWKRPDLAADRGAELAHEMAAVWSRAGLDPQVAGGIFDLREAPPVFGPRTEAAFAAMLARLHGKHLALLHGDNPVQRLQLLRIAAGHAHAAVVDSLGAARAHAQGAPERRA